MSTFILCNLRTGRRIQNLPVLKGSWDDRLGATESIEVTLDMNDPDVRELGLRNSATPAQAALCAVENGVIVAGGPIWTHDYSRDNATIKLGAKGMASYFDHRLILPLLARTIGMDQWTIPDPADPEKTIANPALSTTINGVSLGTIAKRLVQQARLWTGGEVPVVFQDDELNTTLLSDGTFESTRTYLGVDFKSVLEAIEQISQTENGPEINFLPRFTADSLGVEWLFQTGTTAQPLITSNASLSWSITAPDSPVSKFETHHDSSGMGSLSWWTGGRQADDVIVSRAYDPKLIDAGYPLLERVDTSHSTVSVQSTLDSYAAADVAMASRPTEIWSFTVQANPVDEYGKPAGPWVGQYSVGDFIDLIIDPMDANTGTGEDITVVSDEFTDIFYDELPSTVEFDPVVPGSNAGDPYLPQGGKFRHRILGLSGDEQGEYIQIQCTEKVGD